MKNERLFLGIAIVFSLFVPSFVLAANCWQYDENQNDCETAGCQWHQDDWGSWCEEKGCWNYYTESTCPSSIPGTDKNCIWQSSSGWGWCEQTNCYSFSGTNETACTNNVLGLQCEWENRCFGGGAANCWEITNEYTCKNTSGCWWGDCMEKGCWDYQTSPTCTQATGMRGYNCSWNLNGNYCYEKWCGDYSNTNETACASNPEGMNCKWVNNYYTQKSCEEISCWQWDYTNETTCQNNEYNLSCNWDGQYCMMGGCMDKWDATSCGNTSGCSWKTSMSSGWCEDVNCWTWDGWRGGNQSNCESNNYNKSCAWQSFGAGENDGWCYVNIETSCSNLTTERSCMDTFYCWWEYQDWNNISAGGNCREPGEFGGIEDDFFQEFNPGCYIFDMNSTNCNNILGCEYSNGKCITKVGHGNENTINANGLNCSMINDSSLCNSIPALSSCCEWKAGNCTQNKMTQSCYDDLDDIPVEIYGCEDVNMQSSDAASAETLCNQVAGDPWYMPCGWDNSTKKCGCKVTDIFGNRTQSFAMMDNKKICESCGGKWLIENYCEGNRSVSAGRCEQKASEETNCKKACYACDYKFDGSAHNSSKTAKNYCYEKNPKCQFTEDATAPNGYGFCKAKEQFKKGIATDCTLDCGSCTYMGNPNAGSESSTTIKSYSGCNTPKCFCQQAYEFGNVNCKWITDSTKTEGGYCVDSSEKTCADSCDRCYTQSDCANTGRSALNSTGSCLWSSSTSTCSKSGENAEVCWDAVDNDADNLIDCADSECYADSFCGFVSGDCFGWMTQADCEEHSCSWVTDPWGSWCDFQGADCWKYDGNSSACTNQTNCGWTEGMGTGWCEQDWSMGQDCYTKGQADCTGDCQWTNDTWCLGDGAGTDWCNDKGGWCDPAGFAPKNCWQYDNNEADCNSTTGCVWDSGMCMEFGCWNYDNNKTKCMESTDCNWETNEWGGQCQVDWSTNCMKYDDNATACNAYGCNWRNSTYGGGWCDNKFSACWNLTQLQCGQSTDCTWNEWMWNPQTGTQGSCDAVCFNPDLTEDTCTQKSGCTWSDGWCMSNQMSGTGGINCWEYNENSSQCANTTGCKWKNPGWCNPTGFAGGDAFAGKGGGANTGMECWKYDGNQTSCTNSTLIGISCTWMTEPYPFCEPDWSANCWQYDWNSSACDAASGCRYSNDTYGGGWCQNIFDQCWSNSTLNSDQAACNANQYCNWSNWNSCEPTCFQQTTQGECTGSCRWMTGWCNPPGMGAMFDGMEKGAPTPIANDPCPESGINAVVDICGAAMKDMGDALGIGAGVLEINNASICNQQKIGMGPMSQFGSGNKTTKLFVYLDTDGSTEGGCALSHNTSQKGYEFFFKYIARWDQNSSKTVETFNAYKCSSEGFTAADITLNAWKEKMCGEMNGLMIAIGKSDLDKFPTLYNSEEDMRVVVTTADISHNALVPSDTAGPGWVTPGAIDFKVEGFFEYGADQTMFEDIMKKGFVQHEDCFNTVDDDDDSLIDCSDWDCQFAPHCTTTGVNAQNYTDTSMPRITGVKVEEYTDAALVMYDTNKPTNGTLKFYRNDSTCTTLNTTIYDNGILSNNTINYKLWHSGEIFNGENSLNYNLQPDTNYYYKLEICDYGGKCSVSACTSFRTAEATRCGYCNFVTMIKVPTGWTVSYDLNQNGTYEHIQGQMCGPNAGMKTNYTTGRRANIKLNNTEGAEFWFYNVTLTKTGLTSQTRNIANETSLIFDNEATDASGNTIGYTGMISDTRDKIINNLHPDICHITVPRGDGDCTEIWHCDDSGENCVDRTNESSLVSNTTTTCTWKIPYCEFSVWASGEPGTPPGSTTPGGTTSGGGGGGGGGGGAAGTTNTLAKQSRYWSTIAAGSSAAMDVNNEKIGFTKITFEARNLVGKVDLAVSSLKGKPSNESEIKDRKVYQYLDITPTNINDADIANVKITFKVSLSWFTENNVDSETVRLNRYTNNNWVQLTTRKTTSDGTYQYYEATTPGFSYFAITGIAKTVEEAPEEPVEMEMPPQVTEEQITGEAVKEPAEEALPEESKRSGWLLVLMVFVVLLALLLFIVKQKRKQGSA